MKIMRNVLGGTLKKAFLSYEASSNKDKWCGYNDINSIGSGPVMKVAPLGMYYRNPYTAMAYARLDATLTHGSLDTVECAAAIAGIVSFLYNKYSKEEAIQLTIEAMNDSTVKTLMKQLDLPLQSIKRNLNEAYTNRFNTLDVTIIALKMLLTYDNYADVVINTIKQGDDCDTSGAIVGSMAGIIYEIPEKMIKGVKDSEYILQLQKELLNGRA